MDFQLWRRLLVLPLRQTLVSVCLQRHLDQPVLPLRQRLVSVLQQLALTLSLALLCLHQVHLQVDLLAQRPTQVQVQVHLQARLQVDFQQQLLVLRCWVWLPKLPGHREQAPKLRRDQEVQVLSQGLLLHLALWHLATVMIARLRWQSRMRNLAGIH